MRYCYLLCAAAVMFALASPAARPLFYNEFKKDYLDSLKDKKFAEAVDKEKDNGKCLICHVGKQKKVRNDFGKVVGKLLTKKDKDKEKIAAAFKKALATKVDPKKEKSETYMDRLMASKWPAGKLEDLKKDPKKEPGKDGKDASEGEKKEEK